MSLKDEHFLNTDLEHQDWSLSQTLVVTTSHYPDTPSTASLFEHHLDAADGNKSWFCVALSWQVSLTPLI